MKIIDKEIGVIERQECVDVNFVKSQ
jgi:hypothetical protein